MLLALDTAMACCSAALYDPGQNRVVAAEALAMERGHAEVLAPMVGRVLATAGIGMADLSRLAVTTGPGTFTGLRIALAFAQGLGVARALPVTGVNSLLALAAPLLGEHPVLVASDARLGQCYGALYDGTGTALLEPGLFRLEELAAQLPAGPLKVTGSAAEAVLAVVPRSELVRAPGPDHPVAAGFAALAARLPVTPGLPRPLYLKAADARPQARALRPLSGLAVMAVGTEQAAVLAALHGDCFAGGWTAHDLANLLGLPGSLALMVLDHDEPVGFVLTQQAADEAEIITICTRPSHQRRGGAHALMHHLVERLAGQGVRQLFLDVAADNAAARALYQTHGFVQVGMRPRYYSSGRETPVDALLLRRALP
jgi:tRNA threonylcarbamoyladenosine biosynthesis protein TsaB